MWNFGPYSLMDKNWGSMLKDIQIYWGMHPRLLCDKMASKHHTWVWEPWMWKIFYSMPKNLPKILCNPRFNSIKWQTKWYTKWALQIWTRVPFVPVPKYPILCKGTQSECWDLAFIWFLNMITCSIIYSTIQYFRILHHCG